MDDSLIIDLAKLAQSTAAMVCRVYGCWELRDDLVSEGQLALVKSAARYDPDKGVKLETYAYPAIIGAMSDYLRNNGFRGCRVSRTDWDLAKNVRRAHDELMKQLWRQPTVEEIAGHLKVEQKAIEDALELLALGFESLNAAELENEHEAVWEPIATGLTPEKQVILYRAMMGLPENYKAVVILRDIEGLSVEETAAQLGKPPGTVKSDLSRAHGALKKALPTDIWR